LRISDSRGRTAEVPVLAMIGDQQAALFGSNCRRPGAAECTHGTASYLKAFLGQARPELSRLNVYCAWNLNEQPADAHSAGSPNAGQQYCLEAATSVTGAATRWMRDQVGLFDSDQALDEAAARVADSDGLVFVPAFTGLELPFEPEARGTLLGLTLGHHRGHIARAFFEAIGFQMRMILEAVRDEAGLEVDELLVSGGLSVSDLACQIQADLLDRPILRPSFTDTTAWAAGLLAGLGCGLWSDSETLPPLPGDRTLFQPILTADQRDAGYARWLAAVDLVCAWGRENRIHQSNELFSDQFHNDEP
jgi:glycerol kinase